MVGQEQSRAGCIPVIFDKYSLHATPIETLDLIRQINPGSLYMLHTCPGQDRESLEYPVKTLLPNTRVVQAVNEQKYYLRRAEKMKYDQLYRSVMEEELRVAEHELHQERRGGRRSLNEWAAIYGGLTYPDLHPHDTYEESLILPMRTTGILRTAQILTATQKENMCLELLKEALRF